MALLFHHRSEGGLEGTLQLGARDRFDLLTRTVDDTGRPDRRSLGHVDAVRGKGDQRSGTESLLLHPADQWYLQLREFVGDDLPGIEGETTGCIQFKHDPFRFLLHRAIDGAVPKTEGLLVDQILLTDRDDHNLVRQADLVGLPDQTLLRCLLGTKPE